MIRRYRYPVGKPRGSWHYFEYSCDAGYGASGYLALPVGESTGGDKFGITSIDTVGRSKTVVCTTSITSYYYNIVLAFDASSTRSAKEGHIFYKIYVNGVAVKEELTPGTTGRAFLRGNGAGGYYYWSVTIGGLNYGDNVGLNVWTDIDPIPDSPMICYYKGQCGFKVAPLIAKGQQAEIITDSSLESNMLAIPVKRSSSLHALESAYFPANVATGGIIATADSDNLITANGYDSSPADGAGVKFTPSTSSMPSDWVFTGMSNVKFIWRRIIA